MAQPDDLEARVSALETQFRELAKEVRVTKQDAAAARLLAGAADRDVSEFRGEIRDFRTEVRAELRDFRNATTASTNAIREDHLDLRRKVDDGFTGIRGVLDASAAGQQHIVELLNTLIARPDEA